MKLRNCLFLLCAFALSGCATEGNDEDTSNGNGNNQQGGKPGETQSGNQNVPVKPAPKAYTEGASCDFGSYEPFCDGMNVVKCNGSGKIEKVPCDFYDATCEIFADFPGYATCVYPEDECDSPGRVVKKCMLDDFYKFEYLDVKGCSMSSNGKPQLVNYTVICDGVCSDQQGCVSKTCSGEASSCSSDGKLVSYCDGGYQHTIDCSRMSTSCIMDGDFADCEDWGDN